MQAAVNLGIGLSDTAEAWDLGAGDDVEPAPGAETETVRVAYRQAAKAATPAGKATGATTDG